MNGGSDFLSNFGKNLKRMMQDRDISTKELAAATAVPRPTITHWLNSSQIPKLDKNVLAVARHLNTTLEYLVSGEDAITMTAKEIVASLEKDWVMFHNGQYRVSLKIDKFVGKKNGNKGEE